MERYCRGEKAGHTTQEWYDFTCKNLSELVSELCINKKENLIIKSYLWLSIGARTLGEFHYFVFYTLLYSVTLTV